MRPSFLLVFGALTGTNLAFAQDPKPAPPTAPATGPEAPRPEAPPVDPKPTPPPGDAPPSHYYTEPPSAAGETAPPPARAPAPAQPQVGPRVYEPMPPGAAPYPIFEPPPPPEPHHEAPMTALWVGARLGWFVPFGNLWARAEQRGQFISLVGEPWRDYSGSGPMLELDAGIRFGRHYNVFFAWERAELSAGDSDDTLYGGQAGGDTDFWGIGLRASSDADKLGFITEIALGYRRARATWEDGTELQMTEAPFEARIALGADIRLNSLFSLSPLVSIGVGSFGNIQLVDPNGRARDATAALDENDGHGWITLQLGGHFDLLRSKN